MTTNKKFWSVLNEFFVSTENGFINPRADEEITKYRKFSEDGKKGAAVRWHKDTNGEANSPPNATPMATNNHKPITNNHKPIKNIATVVATPDGVSQEVWDSFVVHRKSKKAQVTKMVIDGIQKEADKAGFTLEDALREIVVRNWQSFKAEWFQPKIEHISAKQTNKSFFERDQELKRKRWEEMTGEKWPENDRKAIIEASNFLELK